MKLAKSSVVKGVSAATLHLRCRRAVVGRESLQLPAVVGPIGLLINSFTPADLDDDAVHPFLMALEHARVSETQGAGSMRACLVYAERLLRGVSEVHMVSGRAFARSDVTRVAKGVLEAPDAAAMENFVRQAGASRYIVESTPSRFNSVEFVDSYEFKHASKPVDGVVIMDGCRVLVADGYVETVAEIQNVLERCGREGERLLICGRGFSDDVLHTLAVNRQRGTLACYALTFPFNEDDANTLVDIATIVGGDVVSSIKGQLFSTVDAGSLPRASYARLRGQTFDFRGEGARERIAQVLLGVQNKLVEAEEPVRSILERRVRRLAGACMIVRLADGVDHLARVEAWDLALRSLREAVRGVAEVSDEEAWPGRDVVPLTSLATAHEMARKLVKALESLDSYV